jgi:lipopolysaccharide export LptBFGC system permease protein LptF
MTLLRRHDRYVLKSYWTSLGAVLLFFTVIVVVIHLADRSGRLMKNADALRAAGYSPWMLVAEYYATLLPFVWLQILPLSAILAAAFSLTRLTRYNELAPLVTTGVSTTRVTLPIILSGVVLAAGIWLVQEQLIPALSRRNMEVARLLEDQEPDRITDVPHFDDPQGARLSVAAYQPMARRLEGALLTFRDPSGSLREIRFYPLLAWLPEQEQWQVVEDGTLFPIEGVAAGTVRIRLPAGEIAPLGAGVQLLEVSVLKDLALGLSSRETADLVRADPDNPRLLFMHSEQTTRCLTPLLLLLLGVPFCFALGRQSSLPGTSAALWTSALVYGSSFLTVRLAASGELNPVLLAWLPTVVLGSFGLAFWLSMRS